MNGFLPFLPLLFFSTCAAVELVPIDPHLVGTWTTKSGQVLTGPNFWDPDNETIFEPESTGASYSFTADGYWEEARYQTISNREHCGIAQTQHSEGRPIADDYGPATNPQCISAIIQWQHGTFTQSSNNSLHLEPFPGDGRQMQSQPCDGNGKTGNGLSTLTRWSQWEVLSKYEQLLDTYNGRQRLDLYQWDGTPESPMWLYDRSPLMLPTLDIALVPDRTIQRREQEPASLPGRRDEGAAGDSNPTSWRLNVWLVLWLWLGAVLIGIGFTLLCWL